MAEQDLRREFNELREEVREFTNTNTEMLTKVDGKLEDLMDSLKGDPLKDKPGIIPEMRTAVEEVRGHADNVKQLDQRMTRIEGKQGKLLIWAGTVGAAMGTFLTLIIDRLKDVLKVVIALILISFGAGCTTVQDSVPSSRIVIGDYTLDIPKNIEIEDIKIEKVGTNFVFSAKRIVSKNSAAVIREAAHGASIIIDARGNALGNLGEKALRGAAEGAF